MGRQAKLRQERKQGEVKSTTVAPVKQSPWAKLAQRPTPEEPEKKTSFLGKVLDRLPDRLNPLANNKERENLDGDAFCDANEQVLGAIAWEGYEKNHQKGAVFVRDMGESPFQMSYISQGSFKKKLSRMGIEGEDLTAIAEMVKNSNPKLDIVLLFCDRDGKMAAIVRPTQPSPPECYQILQPELE
ncbi:MULTISPECIES: hypothetical protein [Spirulina sp. CCY15215]|uniref:hypothetical protein n=1 Tax=Spirulina sp. CCY15215 TaxID=2767591 RepID=UPI00194DB55C|nr:hypothetical protein [Spirulina major]